MPSLRELWRQVVLFDSNISPRLCAFVESLVEALEPEGTDVRDATILNLRSERNEARGETERLGSQLRKDFTYWNERCRIAEDLVNTLRRELVKAKAETERLRKRKAWWEHSVKSWKAEEISWHEEMDELRKECNEAKAEIERAAAMLMGKLLSPDLEGQFEKLKANAVLGEMVREMRLRTRLVRGCGGDYLAMENIEATLGGRLWIWLPGCSPDPAKALRVIQEVRDDEV